MKYSIKNSNSSDSLWCFQAPRALSDAEATRVDKSLTKFIDSWESHGTPVQAQFSIFDSQFVIVTSNAESDVSGCSKDSLFSVMKDLLFKTGLDFLDKTIVTYQEPSTDKVISVNRDQFRQAVKDGLITKSTLVFDTTISSANDLLEAKFLKPLSESWHKDAFL